MAYTPKTWQCGEPIMADDLNHMEQGIAQGGSGSAPLEIKITRSEPPGGDVTYTMDKTWQEIWDAYPNAYVLNTDGETADKTPLLSAMRETYEGQPIYVVAYEFQSANTYFVTASTDGYPEYVEEK